MNMFKKLICKLFRITTYERKYEECEKKYTELLENYVCLSDVVESYKKDLDQANKEIDKLREICKEPLAKIDEVVNEITAQYEVCAKECQDLIEEQDRMRNKAFAEGRASAYSELGIWRLDAIEHGNRLIMDKDGNVFELLEVEDVKITEEDVKNADEDKALAGEIELDDLVEKNNR